MTSMTCPIITKEERLREYLDDLRGRGVKRIALDMEGDQGMFHYRYSISILQCFDGESAAIIDVLNMGVNGTLREFLTCQDIIKVMFSCGNDVFMAQNVLNCTIAPINDIAVAQKFLDLPINLTNYLNIDKEQKDGFQRANWLLRPIKPVLLEYAVNDVLKLLDIEEELAARLVEKGLYDEYIASSRAASEKNFRANPHTLFQTKFPGYSRMPHEKKRRAATIWIFRELLGEMLDCPVGYLLSKRSMVQAAHSDDDLAAALEMELNYGRKSHKRLRMGLISDLLEKASRSQHIPRVPRAPQRQVVKRRSFDDRQGGEGGSLESQKASED